LREEQRVAATSVNRLAVVLKELGWSYTKLIAELRWRAAVDGIVLPKAESLVHLVSRSVPSGMARSRSRVVFVALQSLQSRGWQAARGRVRLLHMSLVRWCRRSSANRDNP
jgi:hypothetical protein